MGISFQPQHGLSIITLKICVGGFNPSVLFFLVSNFFSLPKYHYFSKQSKNETNQKPITMHDNLAVGYGGQG